MPRKPRNRLRDWLAKDGRPSRSEFARWIGCSHGYISQLCDDATPWPSRWIMQRLEKATGGEVTASDFVHLEQAPTSGGRGRKVAA
jgi:hypothetical protein